MGKTYMIWWHSKYVDEISRDATTIGEILDKADETLKELGKLKILEDAGKIRVKTTGTLNPLYIEILDESVESEVIENPIVEVDDS